MTALERQRLLAHLELTTAWLAEEISFLSAAQLEFRPAVGSWSILEVLEHLLTAEPIYWQDFRKAINATPQRLSPPPSDAEFLWYGIDRTWRQQALPAESPKGRLRHAPAGLEAFRKLRRQMLEYVRSTEADLRGHGVARERCDAYQWLLLISARAQRHTLQIREIKAHPNFPRK